MSAECPRCGAALPESDKVKEKDVTPCHNCGLRVRRAGGVLPLEIIQDYLRELWQIIFHPAAYFKRMPGGVRNGKVSRALGFALVTHWLGAVVAFFWKSLTGGILQERVRAFGQFLARDEIETIHTIGNQSATHDLFLKWFMGTGAVIADPFITLGSIVFAAIFVFIGARILSSEHDKIGTITFESAVKVVAYGMSPAILAVIPFVGSVVSQVGVLIVTVIAVREVYGMDTGRSIVVALFPKLLFVVMILLGVLLFTAAFLKLLF